MESPLFYLGVESNLKKPAHEAPEALRNYGKAEIPVFYCKWWVKTVIIQYNYNYTVVPLYTAVILQSAPDAESSEPTTHFAAPASMPEY